MKASEMLSTINSVEKKYFNKTNLTKERILFFQSQNLPLNENIICDDDFLMFINELEKVTGNKFSEDMAKKVLNNWYLWAKNNIQALENMKTTQKISTPIDWLLENNFRIDYKVFAENATQECIDKIKNIMPENSDFCQKLRQVAENEYKNTEFSYDYLVKIVAGFSQNFSQYL